MKILIALLILSTNLAHAKLWEANNTWNMKWEQKYSEWISSGSVHPEMFSSTNSPYYGAWLDCADASYALRAIFSFENSLPFAVENKDGARRSNDLLISNESKKFDKTKNLNKKIVRLLNFIGESVGTESLSKNDTFPIKLNSIKPGDLFLYKIKRRFGKTIRHSYNIKDINFEGTFQAIYSTQAIAKEKAPMTYRKHKMFSNLPFGNWGFRRFKWPRLIGVNYQDYPEEIGFSNEQYELASKMKTDEFFKYVRDLIKKGDLDLEQDVKLRFNSLCEEAQSRVKYVDDAIAHMNKYGSKCMNYENYDAYSTPARDTQLLNVYKSFENYYDSLVSSGDLEKLSSRMKNFLNEIYGDVDSSDNSLLAACPINYKAGTRISLKTLLERFEGGRVSSHPNDSLEVRWGERGSRTNCKVWYQPMFE